MHCAKVPRTLQVTYTYSFCKYILSALAASLQAQRVPHFVRQCWLAGDLSATHWAVYKFIRIICLLRRVPRPYPILKMDVFVEKRCAEIAFCCIWQYCHHSLSPTEFSCKLKSRSNVRSARNTAHNAFFTSQIT